MKKLLVLTLAIAGLAACGGGGGDDESSFCDDAREVESISDEFGQLADNADPDEVRDLFTRFVSSAEAALDSAPEAIEPTLETVTDGLRSVRDVLANNDYDLEAAFQDPDFAELAGDTDISAASDELDQYLETECGIAPSDTATDDTATDDTATDDTATDDTATDDTATDDTATDDTTTDDTATDDTASDGTGTDSTVAGDEEGLAEQLADEFSAGSGVELTDEQRTCVGRGFIDDIGLETLASVADADDIDSGLLAQIFGILDACGVELPTS